MTHRPPRSERSEPLSRRRIPAFHPVPVGPRADGWTVARQAEFVGMLAETRSVIAACRRVGMGRESAYRLRKRPGAAGFAAAWDTALGRPHAPLDRGLAKSTGLSAAQRLAAGLVQVTMRRGRYAGWCWKPDDNAAMQLLAGHYRGGVSGAPHTASSHVLQPENR